MKTFTRRQKTGLGVLLLVLLTMLCFLPTLGYPFLAFWDDASYVTENPLIGLTWENITYYFTHTKHSLYTPITMLSFMLDYALSPGAIIFRVHNLAAHCITAVFFFLILRKLGIRNKLSLLFALFWAIHPQKVESVCWISERKDVLCGMYGMASIYVYLLGMQSKGKRGIWLSTAAGILCVLSIFSKPAGLTLPGLYVLYLAAGWILNGKMKREKLVKALPAILIGGLGALWSAKVTAAVNPPALTDDWTLPVHNYLWYIKSVIVPDISPIHAYRTTALGVFQSTYQLLGAIVSTVLLYLLWHFSPSRVRKCIVSIAVVLIVVRPLAVRFAPMTASAYSVILAAIILLFVTRLIGLKKFLLWAAGIFIITFPVLGLHKSTFFEWCDRYNYLVSAVTLGLIAEIFRRTGNHLHRMERKGGALFSIRGRRVIAWALCAMVFLLYGSITLVYYQRWRDEGLLFQEALHNRLNAAAVPHLKAVEMSMTTALLRGNADDLAAANECLAKHTGLYQEKFGEYLQIWEHLGGVNEESIQFAVTFCQVHERLLRGGTFGEETWGEVADKYPAGTPVFCENCIVPVLLNDLLRCEAYAAFDLMLEKINTAAVSAELLEYRRVHGPPAN